MIYKIQTLFDVENQSLVLQVLKYIKKGFIWITIDLYKTVTLLLFAKVCGLTIIHLKNVLAIIDHTASERKLCLGTLPKRSLIWSSSSAGPPEGKKGLFSGSGLPGAP